MNARELLAAAALVAVTLSGCGGDDASSRDGTPSPSDAPSPSSSDSSADPSDPSDPSDAATPAEPDLPFPDVPPATGLLLRQETVEMHAPAGWQREPPMASFQSVARQGTSLASLTEQEALGGDLPLSADARIALRSVRSRGEGRRFPDVVVDGETAFHVGGVQDSGRPYHTFGLVRDGKLVHFTFDLEADVRQPERLIASVVNTVRWR